MKRNFIIFFSAILAVILFEVFLRYSPFSYGRSPVEYDSIIGMWHKKQYSNYIINTCYKTLYSFDKNGLPKNVHNYDKNKQDVVLLGDSFIEALMVKNENIIHNSLSKEYNHKYNFMNYALSGTSPTQQFIILKKKVNLSNTKYITQFIFLESDLMDVDSKNLDYFTRPKVFVEFDSLDKYKIISPRDATIYDKISDVMGNFELYTYIKKSLYYLRNKIEGLNQISTKKQISYRQEQKLDLTMNWMYLKGAIYQINTIANEHNITYTPIIISTNPENINIMKDFFQQYNIRYLVLQNEIDFILETFPCDGHWLDKTHINIAKYLKNIGFYE